MPGLENWRFDTPIGRRLDRKKHTIVTNHFRVNAAGIPGCIYQYDVSVFAQKDGVWSRDVVVDGDLRMCISILKSAREKHPEWTPQGCELAYDGRATLFSSARMPLPDKDKAGQECVTVDVGIIDRDSATESKTRFRVGLKLVKENATPGQLAAHWRGVDQDTLRGLDVSLLSRIRWDTVCDEPDWYMGGSKIFLAAAAGVRIAPGYIARTGYFAGLKTCMAGLVCVADVAVGVFLEGGSMLEIMWKIGGFRSLTDLVEASRRGLPRAVLAKVEDVIKSARCKLSHLGISKKIKSLGPAADSPQSEFDCDGKITTVAAYFSAMCLSEDPTKGAYRRALPKGRLQYPSLPCVNVGSNSRQILVPPEFVFVRHGQLRK